MNSYKDVFRSLFYSVLATFILIVVFAAVIKAAGLTERVIVPVNIAIKIVSILAGTLKGVKLLKGGAFKGIIIGLLYAGVCFLVLNLALGGFKGVEFNLYDWLLTVAAGALSGVITVNIKKTA